MEVTCFVKFPEQLKKFQQRKAERAASASSSSPAQTEVVGNIQNLEGKYTAVQLVGVQDINGNKLAAIADSGSSITAISFQTAKDCNTSLVPLERPLRALLANGKDCLLTDSCCYLDVTSQGKVFSLCCYVFCNLQHQLILGNDTVEEKGKN